VLTPKIGVVNYWSNALFSKGLLKLGEVAIAVASLNRMLELGRPEYVRLP
jgi:hypothetical protein